MPKRESKSRRAIYSTDIVFILFNGYMSSKNSWLYADNGTDTLTRLDFTKQLKKNRSSSLI